LLWLWRGRHAGGTLRRLKGLKRAFLKRANCTE
jgi:hypothetical protein